MKCPLCKNKTFYRHQTEETRKVLESDNEHVRTEEILKSYYSGPFICTKCEHKLRPDIWYAETVRQKQAQKTKGGA